MTDAENTKKSDDNKINSNNVVQKFWYEKDDKTGNNCQHWTDAKVNVHEFILSL
jgi:hypothetical protein